VDSPRDTEPAIDAIDETRSRRELLRSGGVAALAGVLGVLGIATTAGAKNGSSVKLGEKNTATKPTTIESKKGPALQARTTSGKDPIGVRGAATAEKGVGVQGAALSGKGKTIGIQGLTASAVGTAGQFVAEKGGTAIDAQAPKDGVALRTKGRLELTERSGSASVSEGGSEFVIPVSGGLSERSLVIATLQEHRPGVHVEAAYVLDAEEGRIVVRLNQAVAEQTKVAWLVLD
jgi:hypothetical protein